MLVGIAIGVAIIGVGVIGILLRRPFLRFLLWGMTRFYGRPVADMYEHVGTKGVIVGGVAIIAIGMLRVIVAVLADF